MCAIIPYAFMFVLFDLWYTSEHETYSYLWIPLLMVIYLDRQPYNVPIINYIVICLVANYIAQSEIKIYMPVVPLLCYIEHNLPQNMNR